MKRLILPLLLLLAIGMLVAAESPASDVVGYFKIGPETGIQAGTMYPFSLPFSYGDLEVNAIMGADYGDSDIVEDLATGDNTYFFDFWEGALTEMNYGSAYWFTRDAANTDFNFLLCGKVDPQPIDITINGNSKTPFALNEAKPIALNGPDDTFLFPDAVDGDIIEDLYTGDNTYFFGFWEGTLEFLDPTHVYWYESYNSDSVEWTYNPENPYGLSTRKLKNQTRK